MTTSKAPQCSCENEVVHLRAVAARYKAALEKIANPWSNLNCLHNAQIIAHEALGCPKSYPKNGKRETPSESEPKTEGSGTCEHDWKFFDDAMLGQVEVCLKCPASRRVPPKSPPKATKEMAEPVLTEIFGKPVVGWHKGCNYGAAPGSVCSKCLKLLPEASAWDWEKNS